MPLLQVSSLCKSFFIADENHRFGRKRFYALDNVSLSIEAGETLGLIGESGSGKSTLARVLVKLLPADSGEVFFKGQEILKLSPGAFAPLRRFVQMIFQDPGSSLNPRFTMEETLQEPLIGFRLGNAVQRAARIREMLPTVGLEESILRRYPHQLSGGQLQRVAILSVLLVEPEVIIADEIVSALDLSVQAQILNLWRELQVSRSNEEGCPAPATLFISHDLQVVGWLADRIAVLYRGRIVEEGTAGEVCTNPKHPYTALLFHPESSFCSSVESTPNAASANGCAFYSRCPQGKPECIDNLPQMRNLSMSHRVSCHLY